MNRPFRAGSGYWNPFGPPPSWNNAAYGSGSRSPRNPVDFPVVVVYDGTKGRGCNPSPSDIREEIQPPVYDSDIYPKLLVDIVSKVNAVEEARKRTAGDDELEVLTKEAVSAFLELQSEYGIQIDKHAVFGPLYRKLHCYEPSIEARMAVRE